MGLFDKGNSFEHILKSSTVNEFKSRLRSFKCDRCPLSSEIEQFPTTGRGNAESNIMLVGEAPGHNEMLKGIPFVGRAGQLMDKIFESIGLITENDVYVSNICRCRPPDNRTPLPNEAETCITYLKKEIDLIKPRFIITLGATSSKYLLSKTLPSKQMGDIVGKFYSLDDFPQIEFFVLYHPAALLYNPKLKEAMENHIRLFREKLALC